MNIWSIYLCNYQHYRAVFIFLLLSLNFQVFGNKVELGNTSKFGLKSISFVQESINVSHSNETVFFSLRAYSQIGLSRVIIYFISPSGKETLETSCINNKKTKASLLLGHVIFKKKSEIGVWKINKIIVEDSEGNQESYDNEFLIRNKFTYSLQIKNH